MFSIAASTSDLVYTSDIFAFVVNRLLTKLSVASPATLGISDFRAYLCFSDDQIGSVSLEIYSLLYTQFSVAYPARL